MINTVELLARHSNLVAKQPGWLSITKLFLEKNPSKKGVTLIWPAAIDLWHVQSKAAIHCVSYRDETGVLHEDTVEEQTVKYDFSCIHDELLQFQHNGERRLNIIIQETYTNAGVHTVSLLVPNSVTKQAVGFLHRDVINSYDENEQEYLAWSTALMNQHQRKIISKTVPQ